MAEASTPAQHCIECDDCERNSAQFVCKTCSGYLCEECKIHHESRKLTRHHEITQLKTEKEELLGLLHCSEHKTKKLECFCDPCKKPVCTDCIVLTHNGHNIKTLLTAYEEIRDSLQRTLEVIECTFLPKYCELLRSEDQKDLELRNQANEIEKEIKTYTQNVVGRVMEISKHAIEKLRMEEEYGRQELQKSKIELSERMNILQQTREMLSATLEAKPDISYFNSIDVSFLREIKALPIQTFYQFDKFKPGQIVQMIKDNFGIFPKLRSSNTLCDRSERRSREELSQRRDAQIGTNRWKKKNIC
ncbi:E3 ubiquitin-protein ligase TRIM33-like isoform X2 [Crassostrea virginica]